MNFVHYVSFDLCKNGSLFVYSPRDKDMLLKTIDPSERVPCKVTVNKVFRPHYQDVSQARSKTIVFLALLVLL